MSGRQHLYRSCRDWVVERLGVEPEVDCRQQPTSKVKEACDSVVGRKVWSACDKLREQCEGVISEGHTFSVGGEYFCPEWNSFRSIDCESVPEYFDEMSLSQGDLGHENQAMGFGGNFDEYYDLRRGYNYGDERQSVHGRSLNYEYENGERRQVERDSGCVQNSGRGDDKC